MKIAAAWDGKSPRATLRETAVQRWGVLPCLRRRSKKHVARSTGRLRPRAGLSRTDVTSISTPDPVSPFAKPTSKAESPTTCCFWTLRPRAFWKPRRLDDALANTENLPRPAVLAAQIVEDLQEALDEFAAVEAELAK